MSEPYVPAQMVGVEPGRTSIPGAKIMNAQRMQRHFIRKEAYFMDDVEDVFDEETRTANLLPPATKSDGVARAKAFKMLRNKDVVRRVQRGTYMVNPMFWIPPKNRAQLVLEYNKLP